MDFFDDDSMRLRGMDIVHTADFRVELHQLNTVIATGEPIEGNVCYSNNASIDWILHNEPLADAPSVKKRVNLKTIAQNSDNFLEIGFNAGHSALILLMANPNLSLFCVDIGQRAYTHRAAEHMKQRFGTRFHLWFGDSREVLPRLYIQHPMLRFDALHIDGGHSEGIAFADMSNAIRMARPGAYFIVDDFPHPPIAKAFAEILTAGFLCRSRDDSMLEKTEFHEIVRVV
jgi:predicted O-methyltransferase YrrM